MAYLNEIRLIGRLTNDPELMYLPSGVPVLNFSFACNRKYKVENEDREEVLFVDCVAWQKTAELGAKYLLKGDLAFISGRLVYRTWEDKDGNKRSKHEVNVDSIQFLTWHDQDGDGGELKPKGTRKPSNTTQKDNSVPF
jgi:single-strand DNA-binding protein